MSSSIFKAQSVTQVFGRPSTLSLISMQRPTPNNCFQHCYDMRQMFYNLLKDFWDSII